MRGLVVRHQNSNVFEIWLTGAQGLQSVWLNPQRDREVKDAAAPGLALQPDSSAHQIHQPLADRQPQAAAPVAAGDRVVDLVESFKHGFGVRVRNTHSRVTDRESQRARRIGLEIFFYS